MDEPSSSKPELGTLRYADSKLTVEIDTASRDCESAARLSRLLGCAGLSVPVLLLLLLCAGLVGGTINTMVGALLGAAIMYAVPGFILLLCAGMIASGIRGAAITVFIVSVLASCVMGVALLLGLGAALKGLVAPADAALQLVAPALFLVGFGTLTAQTFRLFARGGSGDWRDSFEVANVFRTPWMAAHLAIAGPVGGLVLLLLGIAWAAAGTLWLSRSLRWLPPDPPPPPPRAIVERPDPGPPEPAWDGDARLADGLPAAERLHMTQFMASHELIPPDGEPIIDVLLREFGKRLLGQPTPSDSSLADFIRYDPPRGSAAPRSEKRWTTDAILFVPRAARIRWQAESGPPTLLIEPGPGFTGRLGRRRIQPGDADSWRRAQSLLDQIARQPHRITQPQAIALAAMLAGQRNPLSEFTISQKPDGTIGLRLGPRGTLWTDTHGARVPEPAEPAPETPFVPSPPQRMLPIAPASAAAVVVAGFLAVVLGGLLALAARTDRMLRITAAGLWVWVPLALLAWGWFAIAYAAGVPLGWRWVGRTLTEPLNAAIVLVCCFIAFMAASVYPAALALRAAEMRRRGRRA